MIFWVFLAGICTADDCGCGGFDTSPPGYGWESPGFSGLDTHESSGGGSTPGGAGGQPSDSGSSPSTGSSISDSGSSGGSSTGGSGDVSSSESSSDTALQLAIRGADYYRKGEMNQSLDMLNKSLSMDPYSVRAWMTKGDVLSTMGRYIEAAGAYSQVLRLDPSDGVAAAKRGDAFMNAGQYTDAIASYDRAITMDPGNSGIRLNRSLAIQLASGALHVSNSVAGPETIPELNISAAVPGIEVTAMSTNKTTLPLSTVPGTTKAALSLQVLTLAIIIAGLMSTVYPRR